MEQSRNFLLVPEERLQTIKHMSEFNKQMKNILQNTNLTEIEKAIFYLQILQKYTNFSIEKPPPEQPDEPKEIEISVEPVIKIEKDDIEEKNYTCSSSAI